MSKGSLKKNFAFNSAYQLLQVITPLVTTPYLARVLGPEQSGVFSYTQSIANYFVLFATLGISTYGVRAIAQCGDDRKLRSRVFWGAYASQLISGGLAALAYVVYAVVIHEGGMLITLLWSLWLIFAAIDVSWLLFGCEEFKIPTIRSTATKLLSLVFIFTFVKTRDDLWLYVLAISGSFFLNGIIVWPFVRRYVDYVRPSASEVKRHLKGNIGLFVPVIAVSVYTTLDKIMLGVMSTEEQVAFFSYSERISRLPLSVLQALGVVMMPRMSYLLMEGQREKALGLLKNSIWIMLAASMALAFGISAVAPEFVPVFLGEGYEPCVGIMTFLVVIIPVISVTNVIGKQYLLPLSRDREYTLSLIVGAAFNVAVNVILIPRMGAAGAAIGTIAAEVSILVVQVACVRGELPLLSYFKGCLPFVCIGATMFVSIRLTASFLAESDCFAMLSLGLEVILGALVFVLLTAAFCFTSRNKTFFQLFGYGLARRGGHGDSR